MAKTQPISSPEQDIAEAREEIAQKVNDGDAVDIAWAAVDELADQAKQIEAVRTELDKSKELAMRQAAEFQNYRRRSEQEKKQAVEIGKNYVITRMLDVFDDFGRSMEAIQQSESEDPALDALKTGIEMVYKKMQDELSRLNVHPIEAEGQPFDENEHEAMMQQPAPDGVAPGTVLQAFQTGYKRGDRVLRHARVIVAS
ncbi:MAG: nucleotide exchange factor GrpE [Rhodothermales bacterium]